MLFVADVTVASNSKVNTGEWVDVTWVVDRELSLSVNSDSMSTSWSDYRYIHSNDTVRVVVGARLYTSGTAFFTEDM